MHYADHYNDKLSYDARAGYRQALAEGDALSGRLGLQSQIIALAEVYRELRAAGKFEQAAEIKRRVNLMVEEGK